MSSFTASFKTISINDLAKVGGKNASLGEMFQKLTLKGINIPDGFAVTSKAYWEFLKYNKLKPVLSNILNDLDRETYSNLMEVGESARKVFHTTTFPNSIKSNILEAYQSLKERTNQNITVAVRSSATAEDLPEASFAGQQESFLNIDGEHALLEACLKCYESLFTDRAIKYRIDNGFNHMDIALSIGVQQMVRSDLSCSGVGFTLEPESGFRDVVVINGAWGLGENVVKGRVEPDEFIVYKPSLKRHNRSIISKKLGKKEQTMVYSEADSSGGTTMNLETSSANKAKFILSDQEIEELASWSILIEDHYGLPMDIEWAKDGISKELYIVQARPETVHSLKNKNSFVVYKLKEKANALVSGHGLGNKITAGRARILKSPTEAYKLQKGEVLVTDITDPDWDPILKKAAAIITNRGGRTSHAAIVAREQGAVAVVGTTNGTEKIKEGQMVTVSSAEGKTGFVYNGKLNWEERLIDPTTLQIPQTDVMLILGDPEKSFHYAQFPNSGIGLMRLEFIIANTIQTHPMALVKFDELDDPVVKEQVEKLSYAYGNKPQYFVEKLAEAVGTIAAAFYPKDVIVRMSDFKSNEYANLLGGKQFEPEEENPMLGFRGASRYNHSMYRDGFRLECEAMKIVRNEMGFHNVKLMIPFCRTIEEGKSVIELMAKYGLQRGVNQLQIYTMIEIPSNVILANEFAKIFDGFSIGTNDLTQLVLGIDRDNSLISDLFDENNLAVKKFLLQVIHTAKQNGIKIGLCGQAPSDFPQFAQFLVEQGIDSISFNADALLEGIENINAAEIKMKAELN